MFGRKLKEVWQPFANAGGADPNNPPKGRLMDIPKGNGKTPPIHEHCGGPIMPGTAHIDIEYKTCWVIEAMPNE